MIKAAITENLKPRFSLYSRFNLSCSDSKSPITSIASSLTNSFFSFTFPNFGTIIFSTIIVPTIDKIIVDTIIIYKLDNKLT